jgi:hypothetical protein
LLNAKINVAPPVEEEPKEVPIEDLKKQEEKEPENK